MQVTIHVVINAHVVNMFQARLSLCFRAKGGLFFHI